MRYPAAEQLEIIRLVEQSRLPVRRTLDKLGILPASFYRWYDRYQSGGYEALKDRPPRPKQAWNRIPDDVRGRVLRLALDAPALSPRELATRFIDTEGYFVSEASVYRLLKAHDLITSPAFGMIKGRRRVQGQERWTPSFGQVFVTAKVESGFMIQAAFGWPEVGRSPRLRSASSLVYASSGVRPLSDEWGRHRL